jgi:hypothetical protein
MESMGDKGEVHDNGARVNRWSRVKTRKPRADPYTWCTPPSETGPPSPGFFPPPDGAAHGPTALDRAATAAVPQVRVHPFQP